MPPSFRKPAWSVSWKFVFNLIMYRVLQRGCGSYKVKVLKVHRFDYYSCNSTSLDVPVLGSFYRTFRSSLINLLGLLLKIYFTCLFFVCLLL